MPYLNWKRVSIFGIFAKPTDINVNKCGMKYTNDEETNKQLTNKATNPKTKTFLISSCDCDFVRQTATCVRCYFSRCSINTNIRCEFLTFTGLLRSIWSNYREESWNDSFEQLHATTNHNRSNSFFQIFFNRYVHLLN